MVPSLKLTCSLLKMDGWKTFSFPFGMAYFFLTNKKARTCFYILCIFFGWKQVAILHTKSEVFFEGLFNSSFVG